MRTITKKTRIIAIIMTMLFTITSCGEDTQPTESATSELSGTQQPDTLGSQATPTDSEEKADTQQPDFIDDSEDSVDEADPFEFVRNLKIGWNLGNTFDAMDCTWLTNELDYESAWCGVKTTKEMILALKNAAFASIRIPVSWHNHLSDKQNYTISQAWLDRVNTVVDYCIEEDLYVIINIHHDNSKAFLYPDSEHLDQSVAYVTSIWQQLAERFGEYDEHLIFEAMNEPRLVGHANEWWIDDNNAECRDAIRCINTLNQTFVDTVRATGGNNKRRYLMCPGYDASPEGALNARFVFPTDPVKSNNHRIIVSVHAYTPYSFALEKPGTDSWSSSNEQNVNDMVWFMDQLYKNYVKKGTPVVIGEFGAQDKNNLDARVDFSGYYIAAARERGMSCFLWDNNAFGTDGENFGFLDRATCTWPFPEIIEAMMKSAEN